MTGSSSKLLQIQGKMVPGKKTKKNPKPEARKTKTILHPKTIPTVRKDSHQVLAGHLL